MDKFGNYISDQKVEGVRPSAAVFTNYSLDGYDGSDCGGQTKTDLEMK